MDSMDNVDKFMNNFLINVKNSNHSCLEDLLKLESFKSYVQYIKRSNAGAALEKILEGSDGLINFIKLELEKNDKGRHIIISNTFSIFNYLLEMFKDSTKKYDEDILRCASEAIGKTGLHVSVKEQAIETLQLFLQNCDLNLHELIKKFMNQLQVCRMKGLSYHADCAYILSALCCIIKAIPVGDYLNDKQRNIIKKQILKYLEKEHLNITTNKIAKDSKIIFLHLNALKCLSTKDEISNEKYLELLYRYLKTILDHQECLIDTGKEKIFSLNNKIKIEIFDLFICYTKQWNNKIIKDLLYWELKFKKFLKYTKSSGSSALKALYDIMPKYLESREDEYKIIKRKFEDSLKNNNNFVISNLNFSIYGYGKLIVPCKKHESEIEVNNMFELTSKLIMSFYNEENSNDSYLEYIPDFQNILSDMLQYIDHPPIMHLSSIIKLSGLLIKKFPELNYQLKLKTIISIKQTIMHISKLNPNLGGKYLQTMIFEGITWTCSHTLRIDEEFQRNITKDEHIITDQNYMQLWKSLIHSDTNNETLTYTTNRLHIKVFKEIILMYKKFLSKLDLRTKINKDDELNEDPLSRVPVNDDDFRIFINLCDFYIEIIEDCNETVLEECVYDILYEAIKKSYADSTISAYYKIVSAIFKKIDVSYWESTEENGKEIVFDLVSQYISYMLDLVCKLLKEPQFYAVIMILNTPFTNKLMDLIPNFVIRAIPVFQLAFTIGTGDLMIAFNALETLERWMENSRNQPLDTLLRKIIPTLEPYLYSTESCVGMSLDVIKNQRKVVKHITIINDDISLENVQYRILLLFGSVSSDIMKDYIYEKSLDTGASWHQKQEFIYKMPLQEFKIDVNLIKILPRTIDLALNSGDRQTKIAACEVLHSIVIMILGSKEEDVYFDKSLCTAILKLGCDMDNIAVQIFNALCLELINYLSSEDKFKKPATNIMLESVFDGLANDKSTADFKEFCGICLKTFITTNEVSDESLEKSSIGSKILVDKLYHFALHPSEAKRVAAAVAFNHLFKDAEQVDIVFNKYLLNLLYCFIKSLNQCYDWRIIEATRKLEDIFILKSYLLNNEDLDIDEIPPEFTGKTLKHAAIWLLKQCSSLDKHQRKRCMDMFEKLAPHVDNCNTAKDFMQNYVNEVGLKELHDISLKDLDINLFDINIFNLNNIIRSLDCYTWIINQDYVSFNHLFREERTIFIALQTYFCNLDNFMNNSCSIDNPSIETKHRNSAICETVIKITSFIKVCLERNVSNMKNGWDVVPEQFWKYVFKLITTAIMIPSSFQFNTENIEYIESLRSHLCDLLNIITLRSNENIFLKLLRALKYFIHFDKCFKILDKQNLIRFQNELLYGCLLQHKCDILNKTEKGQKIIKEAENKISECFKALINKKSNAEGNVRYYYIELDQETLMFYTTYLEIALTIYNPTLIENLIELILNNQTADNSSNITIGDHFLNTFRKPIFYGLLRNVTQTISIIEQFIIKCKNVDKILCLIEDLALFIHENKEMMINIKEQFARELILKSSRLIRFINKQRKTTFMNIYKFAVQFLKNPLEVSTNSDYYSLREWIMCQFSELKTEMVQHFLVCLTDSSLDNFNDNLMAILIQESQSSNNSEMRVYFETLSKMLPITKSIVVLKSMIKYSAGKCQSLYKETTVKYLVDYILNIPERNVIKSLTIIYDLFLTNNNKDVRMDIFNNYLWLLLNYCSKEQIKTFYNIHINEIYKIIIQEFNTMKEDEEQLIISKITSYKLFAHMLSTVVAKDDTNYLEMISEKIGTKDKNDLLESCIHHAINVHTFDLYNIDKEYGRILYCQAYNCYLTLCTITKKEQHIKLGFLNTNFKQNLIWENIINKEQIKLQQTFPEQPKTRKEFINLRRTKRKDQTSSQAYSFIHFYDLNTSTLREDINTFDFNESKITSGTLNQSTAMEGIVEYKCIDYNGHECMQMICEFFEFLIDNKIVDLENSEIPVCVKCIEESLENAKEDYIKIFLMRVILNSSKMFKPYMKDIMWSIIHTIDHYLHKNNINYIISEMLIEIMKSVNENDLIPRNPSHISYSNSLINKIVIKIFNEVNIRAFSMTLDLLNSVVNCWQETAYLSSEHILKPYRNLTTVTDKTVDKTKSDIKSMMNVVATFLSYKGSRHNLLRQFDGQNPNLKKIIFEVLKTEMFCVDNLKILAFEAMGLILEESEFDEYNLTSALKQNSNVTSKCVLQLCKSNPKLGMRYRDRAFCVGKMTDESKQRCINILLLLNKELSEEEIIKDLSYIEFYSLMTNKSNCYKIGLDLISVLSEKFSPPNLEPLAKVAKTFANNNDPRLRKIVYQIFQNIIQRFFDNITEDPLSQSLVCTSESVLVCGLGDVSEDLSEMVCKFWTEGNILPSKFSDRLMKILDMYIEEEKNYLFFICIAMFGLVKKSPEYNEKIYSKQLGNHCSHTEYEIYQDWRSKTLINRTPLHVKCNASQLSQVYKCSDHRSLRATLTNYSYAQPLMQSDKMSTLISMGNNDLQINMNNQDRIVYEGFVKPSSFRDMAQFIRKVENKQQKRQFYRQREIEKNKQQERDLKDEPLRRKNHVKIYRKYEVGIEDNAYPNIKITNKDMVEVLLKLMKKDRLSCKNMFLSFMRALLQFYEKLSKTEIINFKCRISDKIQGILSRGQNTNPAVTALLELLHYTDLSYNEEIIAKVTKSNETTEVGILLLEKKLLQSEENYEPLQKKPRITNSIDCNTQNWVHLSSLYKKLNHTDVVLSIFGNYIPGFKLKEACLAHVTNNWNTAAIAYKEAICNIKTEAIRNHCLQGMYECYSQLSNWKQIDKSIEEEIGDFEIIWDKYTNKNWLTPWIFRSKLYNMLDDEKTSNFESKLFTWLQCKETENYIKRHYGEEISMFAIHDKEKHSKILDWIKLNLNEIRDQWQQINALSAQIRIAKLQKLHGLSEISAFINHYPNEDEKEILHLIDRWSKIRPSSNDDCSYWDMHTKYRLYFSHILAEDKKVHKDKLMSSDIKHIQTLLHFAFHQENKFIVKNRYFGLLEQYVKRDNVSDVDQMRFLYNKAAYKYMCAERNNVKRIPYYIEAWEELNIVLTSNVDLSLKNDAKHLAAKISFNLSNDIEKDGSLLNDIKIFLKGDPPISEINFAIEHLTSQAFELLSEISEDNDFGKSQLIISRFCHDKIYNNCSIQNIDLIKKFIESTLKAMAFDVDEATCYFPCILKEKYFQIPEIRETFVNCCKQIESWRFLTWRAQLISFLDKPFEDIIIPIIKRLIDDYPDAVLYTFNLTINLKPNLLNKSEIANMQTQIFKHRPNFEKFQKAMRFVVKPNIFLMQKIEKVVTKLKNGITDKEILKTEFDPNEMKDNDIKLSENKHYETMLTYSKNIINALSETPEQAIKKLKVIRDKLDNLERYQKLKNERLLSFYSTWLSNYTGGNIEVPGQYKGNNKPIPKYHAKIMRMEPNVEIMFSKYKPIKITILGNNGKSYSFLVKSGDDLRLDQRIQQTLSFINKILQSKMVCKQRNLSIYTYEVVPFSNMYGLIEWVNGTKTLRNFIPECSVASTNYFHWIRNNSAFPNISLPMIYKMALRKDSSEVITKMLELQRNTKWDSLRETFVQLSPSLECFVTMRHTFTITYATMCIAHWILGIGDRHMKNTLVEIKSGRCIGIDFGLAFGAGIDILIPELMPFRLTSQILGVLKPFSENDLLAITMVNVLKALKIDKGPLLACLDIFINEPLDWEYYIKNKFDGESEKEDKVEWSPIKRIEFVEKKLNGVKPSIVTLLELQTNPFHSSKKYYDRYVQIINGTDHKQMKRSQINKETLSSEEQVSCLLDQATDLNILGRTYEGWEPWL